MKVLEGLDPYDKI